MEGTDSTLTSPSDARAERLALGGILALALVVRVVGIDAESLWYDEAITWRLSRLPLREMLADRAADGHPPGYFLLLQAWTGLFGESPTALRALSVVPSVLSVLLLSRAARRMAGPSAGLWVGALAALHPYLVRFAQEARDYSFLFLFGSASFVALDRVESGNGKDGFLGWIVGTSLAVWFSVFGLVVWAGQVVYLALRFVLGPREGKPPLGRWLLANVAVLVIYLPWLVVLAKRAARIDERFWIPEPDVDSIFDSAKNAAGSGVALGVLGLLLLVGLWTLARGPYRDRGRAARLVTWLLTPVLVPLIVSVLWRPIYLNRSTIVCGGAFVLLAGIGLDAIRRPRSLRAVAAIAALLACFVGVARSATHKEPWREATAWIEVRARPGDLVRFGDENEASAYLAYRSRDDLRFAGWARSRGPAGGSAEAAWSGPTPTDTVWLVTSAHTPKAGAREVQALLAKGFSRHETFEARGVLAARYTVNPAR